MKEFLKRQGRTFRAAVLSIDVVDSTNLVGTSEQLACTRSNLEAFVADLVSRTADRAMALQWGGGDGGFLLSVGAYDDLVLLGDRLLALLHHFNRSRNLNLLPHDRIHLRLVCHAGTFKNDGEPGTLFSQELNHLKHGEKRLGVRDHLVVSSTVYAGLGDELRCRFSYWGEPDRELGQCYVLDKEEAPTNLHLNEGQSQDLVEWIKAAIRPGEDYELCVFSYTNESLDEFLAWHAPRVQVRVLVRSWLAEYEDETKYNEARRETAGPRDAAGRSGLPGGWFKSEIIRVGAEYLMEMKGRVGDGAEGKAQLDIRFYERHPLLKGVILRNKGDGRRKARIGFYRWDPDRQEGTSPYVGSGWADVVLEEDGLLASRMLDAVQSRFEEFWVSGRTYAELLRESPQRDEESCKVIWNVRTAQNYLFVVTGRDAEKRRGPFIAGEDMIGMQVLESLLNSLGARVELVIVPSRAGDGPAQWDRILNYPGHVVFICRLSLNHDRVVDHLERCRFPFAFSQDKKRLALRDRSSRTEFVSPMDWEPSQDRDYCVVGRCPSPSGPGKWLVVAGIHAMGTWGGCEFMANRAMLRKLFIEVDRHDFALVVETRFEYPYLKGVYPVMAARTDDLW